MKTHWRNLHNFESWGIMQAALLWPTLIQLQRSQEDNQATLHKISQ
jgi:hypothetical protein